MRGGERTSMRHERGEASASLAGGVGFVVLGLCLSAAVNGMCVARKLLRFFKLESGSFWLFCASILYI